MATYPLSINDFDSFFLREYFLKFRVICSSSGDFCIEKHHKHAGRSRQEASSNSK